MPRMAQPSVVLRGVLTKRLLQHAASVGHAGASAPAGRVGRRRMLRVAQPNVVLGEAASPVLYCFSMRSEAMAFPRTPRPACRFSSEYSANVPPARRSNSNSQ